MAWMSAASAIERVDSRGAVADLESALAADFKRLRSGRGSFAPACVKNAATARAFLTLVHNSWTALRNWLPVLVVSAWAVFQSC